MSLARLRLALASQNVQPCKRCEHKPAVLDGYCGLCAGERLAEQKGSPGPLRLKEQRP